MPTLLTLPVELLEAILEAISSLISSFDLSLQDLAAFSQTCKILYRSSLRHLYNDVSTEQHWLLARTLITRPDLAQLVKTLSLPCDWSDEEDIPPEVDDYWERKAEGHSEENRADPTGMTDVVSSLCPNLEELDGYNILSGTPYFWTPNLLPKLANVCIYSADDSEVTAHFCELEPLFRAAPNIKDMQVQRFHDVRETDVELTQLMRIDFVWSCIDAEQLRHLLKMFPNLEELVFTSAGTSLYHDTEPFTVREAKEVILANAPRLKVFWMTPDSEATEDLDGRDAQNAREEFAERGIEFKLDKF
jgi:hypothetical protein